jgi:hypothetical protein
MVDFKRCSILQDFPAKTTASMALSRQPRSPREAAELYMEARQQILLQCEPYVKIMIDLRNLQSVRYQVTEDGGLAEQEVLWREGDKKLYDQCQEMIDFIGRQIKGPGGE